MINLLNEAKEEIVRLRRRNEILEAEISIVEIFAAALGLKRGERGMGLDVVYSLEEKIKELSEPSK